MNSVTSKNQLKEAVNQAFSLITGSIANVAEAGEFIAKAMDDHPGFADAFCEMHPEITQEGLRMFEMIGRKMVHPRLFMSDVPGYRRLRRLSYAIQEQALSKGVTVLVKENGGYDTLKADVVALTKDQSNQVFAYDHIRSAAEQRLFIESANTFKAAPVKTVDESYRISGKKLIIMAPCQFTAGQVARILMEMQT